MCKFYNYLILIFLYLSLSDSYGQQILKATEVSDLSEFNINQDLAAQLPSLEELTQLSLEYSPKIKKNLYLTQSEKEKVFLQKKFFAQHIQAFVNLSTGNQGVIITGADPNAFNTIANGYRLGLNISVPFYELYSRKNRINLAQSETKAQESLVDEIRLLIEDEVARAYYQVISTQKIMLSSANFLELAITNMQLSEKKLLENQTTFADHTRLSETKTLSEERYYRAYSEFLQAFRSLEILVGIKLSLLKL